MPDSKKLLLIGWDAADWKIMHGLMDQGLMPNVSHLVETGTMGNLSTLWPVLSPMLWTSIATGKRPHKHGIYGFTEPTPDGLTVQPMTNLSRRSKAIWNILNQQGMESVVIGWWPSHPAEPINGVMVSDYYHKAPRRPGQSWKLMPAAIHPQRLFSDYNELRVHPEELEPGHVLPFVPNAAQIDQDTDMRLSVLMRMIAECTTIQTAATHALESEPWDFAAIYFDAIDHFCHAFMRFHPPQQKHVSDEDFAMFHNVVTMGYQYHDLMLGRLLDFVDDDTTVMLISDHGFHADHLRLSQLPSEPAGPAEEHREYGIFVINGPGIRQDSVVHGAGLLDITPTILSIYDLPVGDDMDGRVLDDVFESTPSGQTIPSWEDVEGNDGQHPADYALDPVEAKEALEQLIALGYIDRPSDDSDEAIEQCTRELDYNLARSYMDAGMHGEATPILTKLYNENPLEFRFGIQLANCLSSMGRYDDLERLVSDLNQRWRLGREEARDRLKEVAKVARHRRKQWDEFKRLDEENADVPGRQRLAPVSHKGKPILFSESESHDIRRLRAVARGNPQTLDFLQATIHTARGDHEAALKCLEEARLTRAPDPNFQYHVGSVYLSLKRLDEARAAFTRALRLDPEHTRAMTGLCRVHRHLSDHDASIQFGRKAIGLRFEQPAAHFFLGNAYEDLGEFDDAIRCYNTALEQNPNFVEAHDRLVSIFQLGQPDAERAAHHIEATKELRKDIEFVQKQWDPISLPDVSADEIRKALPEIELEDTTNSDTFLRCLGQTPLPNPEPVGDPDMAPVVVVSGLPRSGTSMMMQMLDAAGVEAFTDGERIPDENNPKGYFEAELVKGLSHRNDWVAGCGGQAVKIVAPLIPYMPSGLPYRVIFMDRRIDEVVESQTRMLERLERSGGVLEEEQLAHVFQQQVQSAMGTMAMHNVPVLIVSHADAIARPHDAAAAIAEFLGIENPNLDAMAAVVDPSLHRQRREVNS